MKTAVVYQSKYGFAETYARWIAEELDADLLSSAKVQAADLQPYQTLIFGGGLYAGGVEGIAALTKNFEQLQGKALYLFTVGASEVTNEENIRGIRESLHRALTPSMQQAVRLYHFRGGFKFSKMSLLHRMMMGMMIKILRKKPTNERRPDEQGMLDSYGQDVDFTDRASIAPLLADVRSH